MIEMLKFSFRKTTSCRLAPPSFVLTVLVEEVHARQGKYHEGPHQRAGHGTLRHSYTPDNDYL